MPNNNVASVVVTVLMQLYMLCASSTQKGRNQGNKQKAVNKRK